MKNKVYLSKKFYVGRPFSDLEPEVEMSALNSLKKMLLDYEEYEKVRLVQNRIDEVEEDINIEEELASLLIQCRISQCNNL